MTALEAMARWVLNTTSSIATAISSEICTMPCNRVIVTHLFTLQLISLFTLQLIAAGVATTYSDEPGHGGHAEGASPPDDDGQEFGGEVPLPRGRGRPVLEVRPGVPPDVEVSA